MELNKELRKDAEIAYFEPPYHNFSHGIDVWEAVMALTNNNSKSPEAFGALLHDAFHTGEARAPWDEKIAVKGAILIGRKHGFSDSFIQESSDAIMGTVFADRGNLLLSGQKIIADADLSSLGSEFHKYIKNAVSLLLEQNKSGVTDEEIIKFFSEGQESFFNHLTEISGKAETPYLTQEGRVLFPHFSQNRDRIAKQVEEKPESLIQLVRNTEQEPHIQEYRQLVA